MTQKTIIVTGGAGFIGSSVIRQYINDTQYTVINVDLLMKNQYGQYLINRAKEVR